MQALDLLPIELTYFDVEKTPENEVLLKWETASETNNDFFTIERSIDGTTWNAIARVEGKGNSTVPVSYTSLDNEPFKGTSYYRLKQTDFDGKFSYSLVKSITLRNEENVVIYPNPVENVLTIKFKDLRLQNVQLIDNAGRNLTSKMTILSGSTKEVVLDLSLLTSGHYYLVVNDEIVRRFQKL